jgi:sec-independent protein translocase protein TatB
MFDLGWMEMLIIGVTALIVVGPKDLPKLFKKVGMFVGKAKRMAREFQRGMEDAADESGLKEASKLLETVNSVKEDATGLKKKAVDNFFTKDKPSSVPNKFSPNLNKKEVVDEKGKAKSNKNSIIREASLTSKSVAKKKSTEKSIKTVTKTKSAIKAAKTALKDKEIEKPLGISSKPDIIKPTKAASKTKAIVKPIKKTNKSKSQAELKS